MLENEVARLLGVMELACLKGAAFLVRAAEGDIEVTDSRKADGSLVLNLDIESQRIIFGELDGVLPLVGEETPSSHTLITPANTYLVIDPIDGTSACKRFLSSQGGQVGFGPIIGLVVEGTLRAACYYNVPERSLFSAIKGGGAFKINCPEPEKIVLPALNMRQRLIINDRRTLSQCCLLFYPGLEGEVQFVLKLRKEAKLESINRFGGFANDCTRLAQGYEQIIVQFRAKAWDIAAALIPMEAGLAVTIDPKGRAQSLTEWKVELENPAIVAPVDLMPEIGRVLRDI